MVDETVFPPGFRWNLEKERISIAKHGVDFWEASTTFEDPAAVVEFDFTTTYGEDRSRIIGRAVTGRSLDGRTLVVAFTEREPIIWIITARLARPQEARKYEEQAHQRGF